MKVSQPSALRRPLRSGALCAPAPSALRRPLRSGALCAPAPSALEGLHSKLQISLVVTVVGIGFLATPYNAFAQDPKGPTPGTAVIGGELPSLEPAPPYRPHVPTPQEQGFTEFMGRTSFVTDEGDIILAKIWRNPETNELFIQYVATIPHEEEFPEGELAPFPIPPNVPEDGGNNPFVAMEVG